MGLSAERHIVGRFADVSDLEWAVLMRRDGAGALDEAIRSRLREAEAERVQTPDGAPAVNLFGNFI